LSNPQFTADGKYLIVQSDQPALCVYDTQTWERVPAAPGMPQGALAFYPARSGQTSVYLSSSGKIALWSSSEQRNIAVFDDKGRLERVAYSPDESMVATVTVFFDPKTGNDFRIRLWSTENGELIRELRTLEQSGFAVEGLMWWPDGKFVLAATRPNRFWGNRNVGIWSVETGRHRAELTGCGDKVFGLALLGDGRLFEGCGDGEIRMWQVSDIVKQVISFEESPVRQ
jgi:WD40 repeat protein